MFQSDGWKYAEGIIKNHQGSLQKNINSHIRKGDYRLADREQAKYEDINKISSLIKERMKFLKEEVGE